MLAQAGPRRSGALTRPHGKPCGRRRAPTSWPAVAVAGCCCHSSHSRVELFAPRRSDGPRVPNSHDFESGEMVLVSPPNSLATSSALPEGSAA